jgi:membrane fusion protein (multidrug efflux system)
MSKIKAVAGNFLEKNTQNTKGKIILSFILFTIFYIVYSVYVWINTQSTDNAYLEGNITLITPKVSGEIKSVNFIENSYVKAGDTLITIEDLIYKSALDQAKSSMEAAFLAIKIAEDEFKLAKLMYEQAELDLNQAKNELHRVSKLANESFSTKKLLENAEIIWKKAQLGVEAAKEKLSLAEFATTAKKLAAESAKNALIIAQENFDNTKVKAPINGIITNSSAKIGATPRAGLPIFAIVPKDDLYLKANFKETQITKFRSGMSVDIRFDAIKGINFKGKIRNLYPATGSKFSLIPTDNATGNFTKIVQRIPVIIDVEIPEIYQAKIAVGFSAHVNVRTDQ